MDPIDQMLMAVIAQINYAVPNPMLWRGKAAATLALSLDKLSHEVLAVQTRLNSWAM